MRATPATLCVMLLCACGPLPTPISGGGATTHGTSRPVSMPAPLMGGAVLVTKSGRFAVVADADGDALHLVDLQTSRARRVELPAGSRPNRLAEDARGDVRVALRGSGQVATVSLTSGQVEGTQAVCPEPRGLAWDAQRAALQVACASGHLVTLPLEGSSSTRFVAVDLRDVVPVDGRLLATTFREGLVLDVTGPEPVLVTRLPDFGLGSAHFRGGVAWRAIPGPDGTLVVTHQRERSDALGQVAPDPNKPAPTASVGAYGSATAPVNPSAPCDSGPAVRSAVTVLKPTGEVLLSTDTTGVLPVDVAVSADGLLAVANPGNHRVLRLSATTRGVTGCTSTVPVTPDPLSDPGEVIGVGFTPTGQVVTASRDPAQVTVTENGRVVDTIALAGLPDANPGATLFHAAAPAGLACASCHPEGGDDGHVWTVGGKVRRSQPLQGGVTETAPFHWQGEHRTLDSLMDDTFVSRMSGPAPDTSTVQSLGDWLDAALREPRPAPVASPGLVSEGRQVFEAAGCASCHSGPRLTNEATVDVGTGGAFQVPSLLAVSLRAPLMHDGCAKTVRDRLVDPTCGGGAKHGDVSRLPPSQVDALVAYLESL